MAAIHNFNIEQGSDFRIVFIYQDVNGNPIDISGGNVGFRYRGNTETSVTKYLRSTSTYVKNGNTGEIIIEFPAEVTRLFTFSTAIYDLDFQPSNSNGQQQNTRIAAGTISIIKKNFNTFLDAAEPPPDTGDGGDTDIPDEQNLDGDRCSSALSCLDLDIYSRVYRGSSPIVIEDNIDNSGSISGITSTQTMQKIEVAINGLKHDSPQDLTFILHPPSGDMILLSSNNKISKYDPVTHTQGFSFVFSNSAASNIFLNNVEFNQACNIDDKTDIVKYSTNNLRSNFDHLLYESGADGLGHSITGTYTLYVNDNDRIGSGTMASWDLIITYTGAI